MNGEIPGVLLPLLLLSWLAQMRLCANLPAEEYERERAVTRWGGLGCLAGAVIMGLWWLF
ncbi:MAG: hypothetical protein IIU00_02525 [Clostridia bacterium]|nr:hypothetical protein [Clostridia bacterium]